MLTGVDFAVFAFFQCVLYFLQGYKIKKAILNKNGFF